MRAPADPTSVPAHHECPHPHLPAINPTQISTHRNPNSRPLLPQYLKAPAKSPSTSTPATPPTALKNSKLCTSVNKQPRPPNHKHVHPRIRISNGQHVQKVRLRPKRRARHPRRDRHRARHNPPRRSKRPFSESSTVMFATTES